MVKAKLICKQLNMGKIPYFPGLAMKASRVIFLKAMKRREYGADINLRYLIKMAKIAEYHRDISKENSSLEEIEKKINKSEK